MPYVGVRTVLGRQGIGLPARVQDRFVNELGVETAYPVAEGLSTGVLTLMNNFACLVFLLVPMLPSIGTAWMNWSVVGASVVGGLVMAPFDERYRRLEVDEGGGATISAGSSAADDLSAPLVSGGGAGDDAPMLLGD